jgi:hypothetical protein
LKLEKQKAEIGVSEGGFSDRGSTDFSRRGLNREVAKEEKRKLQPQGGEKNRKKDKS